MLPSTQLTGESEVFWTHGTFDLACYRFAAMTTPLDVVSLIADIDAGRDFAFRFFWGHRRRKDGQLSDACLSQWWPTRFVIDGATYTTAEQWMMASKARLFGDHDMVRRIMEQTDPAAMKVMGRGVQGFVQESWDAACSELVTQGNVAKFRQDARLRKYLLATGDDILVEASPVDTVWGIGHAKDAPEAHDPRKWRGLNLLGFALVRARLILRGEPEGAR